MKRSALLIFTAIIALTGSAMADVKIKSKQTMSGQSSENTTYIKGKRQRTEMMNGMMVSIMQCDLARDLQLNSQTKTYMVSLHDDGSVADAKPVTAGAPAPVAKGGTMTVTVTQKDTGERKQMFGYTARHIIQTIESESTPDSCSPNKTKMEMDMWVIDAEFYLACQETRKYAPSFNSKAGGCQDKIVQKTIGTAKSGYPLWQKMTMFDTNGKESYSMINEVIELSKATLDQSLFDAPADYRQVKDAQEMYATAAAASMGTGAGSSSYGSSSAPSSGVSSSIRNAASTPKVEAAPAATLGAKQPGTIRVGLAGVKTTAVGEGITAADLSAAVQNTLNEYLKGTKIEVVPLEAKLAVAQTEEAKQKECDFVIYATVSHKKGGGGGFGFGKMLAQTVASTGVLGSTGSYAGNVAAHAANNAIIRAADVAGSVKNKDEVTLDVKVQAPADNSSPLAKQYKAKAKGDGDDIISAVVEQAATAIVQTIGK
jgi:hypothetical protein